MRRIMIIGGAGSGKSTLARTLGDRFSLPVHHLDAVFWKPGWVEPDRDDFNARVRGLIATDEWVIEGNYSRTWPERSDRADLIIFLDVPAHLRLYRTFRRAFSHRECSRPDMAEGCAEKMDWAFARWVATYIHHGRPKALALIDDPAMKAKSVHLRRRDVRNFVETLRVSQ